MSTSHPSDYTDRKRQGNECEELAVIELRQLGYKVAQIGVEHSKANHPLTPDLRVTYARYQLGFYAECKSSGESDRIAYAANEYEYHRWLIKNGSKVAVMFKNGMPYLFGGWLQDLRVLAGPDKMTSESGSGMRFYLLASPKANLPEWSADTLRSVKPYQPTERERWVLLPSIGERVGMTWKWPHGSKFPVVAGRWRAARDGRDLCDYTREEFERALAHSELPPQGKAELMRRFDDAKKRKLE